MPMPPTRDAVQVKYSSMTSWLQADGLEHLGAVIALDGRDAHLRHDLDDALGDGLDEVLAGGLVDRRSAAGPARIMSSRVSKAR